MASSNKPILLIMAAGMGSRYGGLKQIDPVGSHGEIILDFSLYDAMLAGFERAVFVIKEENAEAFRKLIDGRAGKYLDVKYAFQKLDDLPEGYKVPEGREKPWGTAHAVYAARDYIDAPFCVINADDYYGAGAFQTMYEFLEGLSEKAPGTWTESEHDLKASCGADGDASTADQDTDRADARDRYAMVAFQLDKTLTENGHVARGVCEVTPDGILEKVTERTKIMWRPASEVEQAEGQPETPEHDSSGKGPGASAHTDEDLKVPAYTEDDGKTWSMLAPETPVSMNFWGFGRSFMDAVKDGFPAFLDKALNENPLKGEYFLPSVVTERIESGGAEVKVLHSSDQWYGVTYKEDKESVKNALQSMKDKGLYPDILWN